MNPAAASNYVVHPMGYACRDCGASAKIGKFVRHTRRCDIAPGKGVWPVWPDPDELVEIDAELAAGIRGAVERAEIRVGVRPANNVTVLARGARWEGPYYVQSFESGTWVQCPGEWHALADARRYAEAATGVWGPSTEFRVISSVEIDRDRRVREFTLRLSELELARAGVVRLGDMLRSATDGELDQLWAPKSKVARRQLEKSRPVRPQRNRTPRVGMLRTLALEFVGHDIWSITRVPKMRPWVARPSLSLTDTVGADGERGIVVADRSFESGEFDYAEANKTGSRGVMLVYQLRQGIPYEVYDRARVEGPRRVMMIHDGQCWHDVTPREAWEATRAQG